MAMFPVATRSFIVLAFLILFVFALSCKDASTSGNSNIRVQGAQINDSIQAGSAGKGASIMKDELYALYISNTPDDEQLKKLLGKNPGNKEKLILQFYRDTDGYLGLVLIPCKKNNKDYLLGDTVLTNRSSHIETTLSSKEPVFLGELQLYNDPPNQRIIDSLKDHIYDPSRPKNSTGWEYIWFVPEVKPVSDNDNTFKASYVIYHIKRDSKAPAFTGKALIEMIEANPSPPRKIE
jgi:hypothetical protein